MITRQSALAAFRLAVLFVSAMTLNSQLEDRPFFSVSSSQTFGSHGTPSLQLSAYGLKAVRVRVYRINDPVQFMRGMPDAHQFGGQYRRGSGKMTLLERLHARKRELRRDIRRDLRSQFTESPSAHLHWGEKKNSTAAHGPQPAYFAEAPVLNDQQLVLSFMQSIAQTENRWDSQKVDIPVKNKGVFLVEVVNGNLRAYTILVVSDIVLVTKSGRDRLLYYVADRDSGEPLSDVAITTMERDGTGTVTPYRS